MPCVICGAPNRELIDEALQVKTLSIVATQFDLARSTLGHHKLHCIRRPDLLSANELKKATRRVKLLQKLEGLLEQATGAARRARRNGDDDLLLRAIRESVRVVVAMGEIANVREERQPPPEVSFEITLSPAGPIVKEVPVLAAEVRRTA